MIKKLFPLKKEIIYFEVYFSGKPKNKSEFFWHKIGKKELSKKFFFIKKKKISFDSLMNLSI